MARREPRFEVTVDLLSVTPSKACLTGFVIHIRTFLEDDNGNVREDDRPGREYQEDLILPEFMFGSDRHRVFVAYCLLDAGWRDEGSLERILDQAFSDAKSILEKEKEKMNQNKNNNHGNGIPTIIFRVKKFLRLEDESEAIMTSELPMEEDPKPVPATKESIQALQKVKLEGDGDGDGLECVICMEKLVSSGSEFITCMPCSHLFHGNCIEEWLNTSHHCPLCRFPMPTDAGRM